MLLVVLLAQAASARTSEGPTARAKQAAGHGPSLGSGATPVTLEVFCNITRGAYCQRTIALARELYARHPEALTVVFRTVAGDASAEQWAAVEKEAWRQGRFFELVRVAYRQRYVATHLSDLAREAGMNIEALERALASGVHERAVARDALWASRHGVSRAPTLVWNGEPSGRLEDIAAFENAYLKALARGRALMARGVPPSALPRAFFARNHARRARALASQPRGQPRLDLDGPRQEIPTDGSPHVGPDDAPVTLVVFYDAACPECALVHASVRRLRLVYGDELRVIYKAFPKFVENVTQLEYVACAAERRAFETVFDAVVGGHGRPDATSEMAAHLARIERADQCRARGRQQVTRDFELGQALGVIRSPTVFVNGLVLGGPRTFGELRFVIDDELLPGILAALW